MIRNILILLLIVVMVFALSSCSSNDDLVDISVVDDLEEQINTLNNSVDDLKEEVKEKDEKISQLETELEEKTQVLNSTQNSNQLVSEALDVMNMIANQDAAGLDSKVSPTNGVRFSPYQYVDENNHIVFYPNNQIPNMFTDPTTYVWGEYDGTGDDISDTFASYYNEFVYDEDFLNPEIIGINNVVSNGNIINNIEVIYPNAEYVEFYFDGFDPQYGGMDWRSLTLVFEEVNGTYYLIGVVHGSWTI